MTKRKTNEKRQQQQMISYDYSILTMVEQIPALSFPTHHPPTLTLPSPYSVVACTLPLPPVPSSAQSYPDSPVNYAVVPTGPRTWLEFRPFVPVSLPSPETDLS